jgi:hypothetical protein
VCVGSQHLRISNTTTNSPADFPPCNTETKELKRRVRDIIDPGKDLGHVDGKKIAGAAEGGTSTGNFAALEAKLESVQRESKKQNEHLLKESSVPLMVENSKGESTSVDKECVRKDGVCNECD